MRQRALTGPQEKTLGFLKRYSDKHGESPTITELQKEFQLKSLRSVTQRLESLERKGFIGRQKFQHRGITILAGNDPQASVTLIEIPVIASAGCDAMQVYAEDEFGEYISVDQKLVGQKTNLAAVRAVGDSMQDAGIKNGDYVIVEVTEAVETGDRVVAIIGNMAVIKQFREVNGIVHLNPENKDAGYAPIIIRQEDAKIFGKVISIIPGSEWIDDVKIEYYPGYSPKKK